MNNITQAQRDRVAEIISAGLVPGLGEPFPGELCIEAAICLAMGEPHSDKPSCVHEERREYSIRINDRYPGTPEERAQLLLPLALAELGTAGTDQTPWVKALAEGTIRRVLPLYLRYAAGLSSDDAHRAALTAAAERCEREGTREAALESGKVAAYSYSDAAAYSYAAAHAYSDAAAHAYSAAAAHAYSYAAAHAYSYSDAAHAYSYATPAPAWLHKLAIETSVQAAMDAHEKTKDQ